MEMTEKHKRSKHTLSLEERVAQFTDGLRQQAEQLPDDAPEVRELRRRIQHGEAALHLNASLNGRATKSSGK
jgi:hypothetical protein